MSADKKETDKAYLTENGVPDALTEGVKKVLIEKPGSKQDLYKCLCDGVLESKAAGLTSGSHAASESDKQIQIFYFADCYNTNRADEAFALLNYHKNKNSIVIGGGDWFGGGAFSKFDRGSTMLEVLQDFEVQISAIGNHEFDHGIARALELFSQSRHKIAWCCANLIPKQDAFNRYREEHQIGEVEIHKTVVKEIGGKKIGFFALLDKNTSGKLEGKEQTHADFNTCFDLNPDIEGVSNECVAELQKQNVDMIVGIAHLDGYYSKPELDSGTTSSSNALSIVVPGVDLVLDASNHVAYCGELNPKQFKGASGITSESMPGYVMGGVDLNFLFKIVLPPNTDDIRSDYEYHMLNTAHVTEDFKAKYGGKEFQEKYAKMVAQLVLNAGFSHNKTKLGFKFDLSAFRAQQERHLTKALFDASNRASNCNVDLLICASGCVRSIETYKKNSTFDTRHLLGLFPFGFNLVVFEATKSQVDEFYDQFSKTEGVGSYPQLFPKMNDLNAKYKNDETLICCTEKWQFDGGDDYPFSKKWNCKVIQEVDKFKFLNDHLPSCFGPDSCE